MQFRMTYDTKATAWGVIKDYRSLMISFLKKELNDKYLHKKVNTKSQFRIYTKKDVIFISATCMEQFLRSQIACAPDLR